MSLRTKINDLESSINEQIAKAVAEATTPLMAKIEEQEKEIKRVKSQINKDSSNSSKPPSTNGFKKLGNNRERSTKKQGRQARHKGNRLNIPENLEELKLAGEIDHHIIYEGYISDFKVNLKIIPEYIETRRSVGTPPKSSYGKGLQSIGSVSICVWSY